MSEGSCSTTGECSAHTFLVDAVRELKEMNASLLLGQYELKETVVKLTENLEEMRRFNERLDASIREQRRKEETQDLIIEHNRRIVDRVAVVGGIGIVVLPVLLQYFLDKL